MDVGEQIECHNKTFEIISLQSPIIKEDKFVLLLLFEIIPEDNNKKDNNNDLKTFLEIIFDYESLECEMGFCTLLGRFSPSCISASKKLGINAPDLARCIFKKSFVDSENNLNVLLSYNLVQRLEDYYGGLKGFPHRLSNHFFRMFYLSSVTITTLGYGDIVPITTAARIAISIEAIMGIVLIGLFLNAVAKRNR